MCSLKFRSRSSPLRNCGINRRPLPPQHPMQLHRLELLLLPPLLPLLLPLLLLLPPLLLLPLPLLLPLRLLPLLHLPLVRLLPLQIFHKVRQNPRATPSLQVSSRSPSSSSTWLPSSRRSSSA